MANEGTPRIPEGGFEVPAEARVGVVAARFNAFVVDRLLEGALAALDRHGLASSRVTVVRVPGAFELPIGCKRMCEGGGHAAVIALGAVIRGETPHFDYVAAEAARGCMRVALDSGTPVIFGVLTTNTAAQAEARASRELVRSNKGFDAGLAALETISALHRLEREGGG
jgi:6,7-dimethyl-8-ribityllumazine synthase